MAEDLNIEVGADVSDAIKGLSALNSKVTLSEAEFNKLDSAIKRVDKTTEKSFAGKSRTLTLYEQLSTVVSRYSAAEAKSASVTTTAAAANNSMVETLSRLDLALASVDKTNAKMAAGQKRTLGLYGQLIGLQKAAADAQYKEAAAVKLLASVKTDATRATAALITAEAKSASVKLQQAKLARSQAAAEAQATAAKNASAAASTRASSANKNLYSQLESTRYALYQVSRYYGMASLAALGFTAASVKVAADYELSFAQVERVTERTRVQLGDLYDDLMQMSTQIPEAFTDLAKVAQLGGQMGIASSDLDEFTDTVARFSAVTDVAADTSAESFGRIAQLLHVPVNQFTNLGSAVTALGASTVATDAEILKMATDISASSHAAGLSTEMTLGLSAAYASLAVQPQVARSSIQRLFDNVNRAIVDNGEALDKWAGYLQVSKDELANLVANDPDQFFMDFIQATGRASETSQGLTQMFKDLSVASVRDRDSFTRLSGSIDLLTSSVQQAQIEYAQGTYLIEASGTIFDTVAKDAERMANSWKNMLASLGGSTAVQEAVKALLNGFTQVFNLVSKLPGAVRSGIVGFIALVGIITGYKAALGAAMGVNLAYQYVLRENGKVAKLNFSSLVSMINETRALRQKATTEELRSSAESVAAMERQILAQRELSAAVRDTTVAYGQQGAAAVESSAVGRHRATGDAAVRGTGGFAAGVKGLLKGGVVIAGLTAASYAVSGLINLFSDAGDEAAKAAAKAEDFAGAVINAGGGGDALAKVLAADERAFNSLSDAARESTTEFAQMTEHWEYLEDGTAKLVTQIERLGKAPEVVQEQMLDASAVAIRFGSSQDEVKDNIEKVNKKLEEQTVILGKNYQQWVVNATQQAMLQNPDWISGKLRAQLESMDISIPEAIAAAITGGKDAVTKAVYDQMGPAFEQATELAKQIAAKKLEIQNYRDERGGDLNAMLMSGDINQYNDLTGELSKLEERYNSILEPAKQLITVLTGGNSEIAKQIVNAKTMADVAKILGDSLGDAGDDAEGLGDDIADAASRFDELVSAMTDTLSTSLSLADAYAALGKSIAQNGQTFSMFTEAGRANIQSVLKIIDVYGRSIREQVEANAITAEQGAQQMGQYVAQLMQQLGDIGIPADQINALVSYLGQVTGYDWKVGIGADISGVVSGVNTAKQLLDSLVADTNVVARSSGVSPAALVASGQYNNYRTTKYGGPTSFAGQGSGPGSITMPGLSDILSGAYNDELQKIDDQLNKVGDSAKGAGKKQEDAAKRANEELKKQQEYLSDIADWYSKIGSTATGYVQAQGAVFEALQKLGQSITENGNDFSAYTQKGRDNLSALSDTLDAFGATMESKIKSGAMSAEEAAGQFHQFASSLFNELTTNLGIPADQIEWLFKSIGDTSITWDKASDSVKRFGGFVEAAAEAAKEATKSVKDNAEALKDYVSRLSEALGDTYDRIFGLSSAVDATTKAFNAMKDSISDVNDEIDELLDQNNDLTNTVKQQEVSLKNAVDNAAKAAASGDTLLAAAYRAQADQIRASIGENKDQVGTNNEKIKSLQKSKTALEGDSEAALKNRDSIRQLQGTMLDQIETYAASGHTQEEVAQYAEKLKGKFKEQMEQLGFTSGEVEHYTGAFDDYITTIHGVPETVKTDVTADTSAATRALNAIPDGKDYKIKPKVANEYAKATRTALSKIPNGKDYKVKVKADGVGAAQRAINGIKGKTVAVKAKITDWIFTPIPKTSGSGGGRPMRFQYKGGLVGSYASGGLVPGIPPNDPRQDNVLAQGPGGMYGLRSREFVQRQEAVDYYGVRIMNAMNQLRIPRDRLMAGGGMVGNRRDDSNRNAEVVQYNTIYYPVSEPASVATNKKLAEAAVLGRM